MGNLSKGSQTEFFGGARLKKGRMTLRLLFLAFCLIGTVEAQMYKCTGADGKTSFSDRPCVAPGAKQETRAASSWATGPVPRVSVRATTDGRAGGC